MRYSIYFALLLSLWAYDSVKAQNYRKDVEKLVHSISYEEDQLFSIFKFVATSIKYDSTRLITDPKKGLKSSVLTDVITQKTGVCTHFAMLFDAMVKELGFEAHIVYGYNKFDNVIQPLGHAWNVVKTNGKWRFYDPTFAAGYYYGGRYIKRFNPTWYNVSPEDFIKTHIPYDPIWQLLETPLTHYVVNGDVDELFIKQGDPDYILKQHFAKDSLTRYGDALKRIQASGITNELIKQYEQYLQLLVEQIIMNKTVDDFNGTLAKFNVYLEARKNKFKTQKWTDELLKQYVSDCYIVFRKSLYNFRNYLQHKHVKDYNATRNFNSALVMLKKSQNERNYIEKYTKTWKPLRPLVD